MDEIPVRMHVWRLFCYFGADEAVSEPYLWVIGFKFDGSTMSQALTRLTWTPDLFFSSGSHGSLGTRDVRPGAKVTVPPAVGGWETTLKPLKLSDAEGNVTEVPGAIGFAAVLLEENNVPADAAEAGHQALNDFVASTLESFVTGIDLPDFNAAVAGRVAGGAARDQAVEDEMRARFEALQQTISDGASDVVEQAIRNSMDLPESLWALIDKDEVMGRAFHLATARELVGESDFTIDYTDRLYENPSLPEAGRWAYNLHSYIKARVRRKALEPQLPEAHDIQIQGIVKGFSRDLGRSYISQVGGVVEGRSWWLSRSDACGMIDRGEKAFYILGADGTRTPVLSKPGPSYWRILTTPPDATQANNLLSLPMLWTVPGFQSTTLEPDPFA